VQLGDFVLLYNQIACFVFLSREDFCFSKVKPLNIWSKEDLLKPEPKGNKNKFKEFISNELFFSVSVFHHFVFQLHTNAI
jgi:hypothetical protein